MKIQKIKNKKAATKLLSIWWFAILLIIAVGIIIGTSIFFSKKIDVRLLESDIIAAKLTDCVIDARGVIDLEALNLKDDAAKGSFLEKCGFNSEIISSSSDYFARINLYEAGSNPPKEIMSPIYFGNSAFEGDCPVGASASYGANYFARCLAELNGTFVDNRGKKTTFQIVAGSNNEYRPQAGAKI